MLAIAKSNINDLSILGGKPTFNIPLHVGRPNLGDLRKFSEQLKQIFDNNWLTNEGPFEREFEERIADIIGVKHCIAMCNGTIALEIAIRAAELSGEVIIPSFTFIATAHALQWQKVTPVFCDIDPQTQNINPFLVEQMITPRTTGIIGVHVWGRPCDIDALTSIAKRNNLSLIFDAAHAFSCSYRGQMIGSFGDAEILSFHATKFLNTFEGGAILTNNDELGARIRLMKNFGFSGYDKVIYIGTNGKMTEISAAMGLTGLESLEEFIAANYRNYKKYRKELKNIPGIELVEHNEKEKSNYQYIVLTIDEQKTGISRDQLLDILQAENILARRYFYPGCHRMEPYRSYFPNAGVLLPETNRLVKRVICLPTGISIGTQEISMICRLIRFVIDNAEELRLKLENLIANRTDSGINYNASLRQQPRKR